MKNYFRIKKRLDHFPVEIEYGFDQGVLVIQGESGAGKTTLLNCISGLKTPDEGMIALEEDIVFDSSANINVPAKRRNIGYVFQEHALFPNMTVQQNITYGIKNLPEYKDKILKQELLAYSNYIMETFRIDHLKSKYPACISGGEKQRVALSRAIVTKPKLLLLDEPFSSLDEKTKKLVYKEFLLFKKLFNIPTILITHDEKESRLFADQKIFIKAGRIMTQASVG